MGWPSWRRPNKPLRPGTRSQSLEKPTRPARSPGPARWGPLYTAAGSPVRTEDGDGGWRPINTDLEVRPDGTLALIAAKADFAFSNGGGADAVVTMRHESGASLGLRWPEPLPTPTVDANVATYPEVLPGVDLQMIALADSFRHSWSSRTQPRPTTRRSSKSLSTPRSTGSSSTRTLQGASSRATPPARPRLHGRDAVHVGLADSRRGTRLVGAQHERRLLDTVEMEGRNQTTCPPTQTH